MKLRAKLILDWPVDSLIDSRLVGCVFGLKRDHEFDDGFVHGFLHDDDLQIDGFVPSDVGVNMRVLSGGTRVSGESGIVK